MITFPNAKINIGLNILHKREDGYHDIESVMYPLKGILYDAMEIIPKSQVSSLSERSPSDKSEVEMHVSGINIPGEEKNNLCIKAYNLIKKDYPVPPVKIFLHKAIPIGAGLGGGSADAAFFIRLLNDKFELGISWGEMHNYARQLGSDCSFFISNQPALAEGKGEQLETIKLDLSGYYIAVIYPNIHINTAEAYGQITKNKEQRTKNNKHSLENDILNLPISEWKKYIHNDFEDAIFPKHPELKKIKEKLYSLGAVYASLSGSGSALYGIFKREPKTKKAFAKYQVWEGKL